jgi:hypothetical protein
LSRVSDRQPTAADCGQRAAFPHPLTNALTVRSSQTHASITFASGRAGAREEL